MYPHLDLLIKMLENVTFEMTDEGYAGTLCNVTVDVHIRGNLEHVRFAAAPTVVQTSVWKKSCCGASATVSPAGTAHMCALTIRPTYISVYHFVEGAALNQPV